MFPRFGGVDDGRFSQKMGYRLFLSLLACSRNRGVPTSIIRPSQCVTDSANSYIATHASIWMENSTYP